VDFLRGHARKQRFLPLALLDALWRIDFETENSLLPAHTCSPVVLTPTRELTKLNLRDLEGGLAIERRKRL
jgi:hypothetical protein